jgi:vitamin B12 transporter
MRSVSKISTILLCGVSFVPLCTINVLAAEDAKTVPTVVVTPSRSPVPLSKIASSVTVISQEEIARQHKATVPELLRQVPGITVAGNGSVGQTSRVFMRGTNSNHVLVLIDGMMVNDPSDPGNAFDFANVTTDNVERIEILRGPQSTMYGSQAIGGVIHIITKQGGGAPTSTAYAEYGSYNTRRLGAGNSGAFGNTSYSFNLSNYSTSGISALSKRAGGKERDDSQMYTASLNIASKLTDHFTAKGNFRYNRTNTEFDSPGSFTRPADDPDPVNDSRQFNGRIAGELSLYDGKWTQELGYALLDLNRSQITEYYDAAFNTYFGRQNYQGRRDTIDWIHRIKPMDDHLVTVGLEAWDESFKTSQLGTVDVGNKAVFLDHQFNIGESFFMNNGVRVDNHQTFGRQYTWKVAPGYMIHATGTRLKTSYGTGFKAPSLSQLYDPSSGNINLSPETSKGWDVGFEQNLWGDKVSFGATYFRNDITQLISFSNSPPFIGLNIGKARTEGVESTFSYRPNVDWTINASHVYTLSQDRSSDQELLRRPKHQANLAVNYDYSMEGDVGMNVRYSSSRRDVDINFPYGRLDVKGFTTVDLYTNYQLNPNITLYGRAENILDKEYEEVFSYGTLGRTFYAGVSSKF